jgi:tetratricopeptide (TPR) repeat protein
MKRRFLPLFLLCSFIPGISAGTSGSVSHAQTLLNEFRDAVYMQQLDDAALYRMYRITLADLADLALDERELLFRKSQAAYYMARGVQAPHCVEDVIVQDKDLRRGKFKQMQKSYDNLDEIVGLYEESLALSEAYLEGGRDARGVRLYAESLSQLSTLKSLGYLMSHGSKIQPLAEEAVALDSGEIKAHLLLASRFIYSPKTWGGDPDKGIAMLEAVSRMEGLDIEDEHNINIGIGFAHTMAERWEEAVPFFRRALEIYPGNVYAEGMIQLCEAGGGK